MRQMQLPGVRRLKKRKSRSQKSPKNLRHVSFEVHRCRSGLAERVFAELWMRWNKERDHDILNKLMPPNFRVTKRDARVVATVVQWLGTNVGTGFLHECQRRLGERVVTDNCIHNSYFYDLNALSRFARPSAWYNFAGSHAFHKLDPLPEISLSSHSLKLAHGKLLPEAEHSNARPHLFVEAAYRQENDQRIQTPIFRRTLAARTALLATALDARIKTRLFDSAGINVDSVDRILAKGELPPLPDHYRQQIAKEHR